MPLGIVGQAQPAVAHHSARSGGAITTRPGVRFDRIAVAGIGRAEAGLPVQPFREGRREHLVDVKDEQDRQREARRERAQHIDDRARAAGRCADRHDLVALRRPAAGDGAGDRRRCGCEGGQAERADG